MPDQQTTTSWPVDFLRDVAARGEGCVTGDQAHALLAEIERLQAVIAAIPRGLVFVEQDGTFRAPSWRDT